MTHTIIIAVIVLTILIKTVVAQDEFGEVEDSGGEAPPSPPVRDMGAMAGGEGQENKNTASSNVNNSKTFSEESIMALKQLGVILGQLSIQYFSALL